MYQFPNSGYILIQQTSQSSPTFSTCTALGKRGLEATDCVAGTAGLLAIPGAVTGAAGAIGGMPGLATWGGIPINKKIVYYYHLG